MIPLTDPHTANTPRHAPAAPRAVELVTVGATCGLAWSTSLRGFMSQVAGPESAVTWSGTFGWILLPGVLVGGLLGWAEHLRRGGTRRRRWLVLAPLLFAAVLVPGLLDPATFMQGGIGGGAIGVPVIGILGGYALSGRGRRWPRLLSGLVVFAGFAVWAVHSDLGRRPGLRFEHPVWGLAEPAVLRAAGCALPGLRDPAAVVAATGIGMT